MPSFPSITRDEYNALVAADATKLDASKVGAANGAASLDSGGKLPTGQLPPSVDSGRLVLPPSNGNDDTTAIQQRLTAGGYVQGRYGETYIFTSPPIVGSNTTLDMTGCTVRLKAGSNCNMLQSAALTAARTVIDGAITAAQATLTSATAAFVAGDVGKAVTVVGAGANGQRLVTTILSVTNATTAVLAANASTTVTNAWTTVGARDQNITLIGGVWDRGANGAGGGAGYQANSIRLRRVDGLRVFGIKGTSTNGKYFLNPGDVWDFWCERIGTDSFSDGVHVNGPARHGVIRDVKAAYSGDDVVSLTAADFGTIATMQDTYGDIDDVLVDGVAAEYGNGRGVLALAGTVGGRAMNVSRITVRNVRGRLRAGAVWIGGDAQDPNTQGGNYTGILVDGVKLSGQATQASNGAVVLYDGVQDDIAIENVTPDPVGDLVPVNVGHGTLTPTIGRLTIDGVFWTGGFSPNGIVLVNRGTVDHLSVNRVQLKSAGTGSSIVVAAGSSTVSRIAIADVYFEEASGGSVSGVVQATSTAATIGVVMMSRVFTKNVDHPLGRYAIAGVLVKFADVRAEGASSWINLSNAAASVTVDGYGLDGNVDAVTLTAGATLRSKSGLRGDVLTTGIAKTAGDQMFNTNAARACGVGPVVSDGTNWKGVFTGVNA